MALERVDAAAGTILVNTQGGEHELRVSVRREVVTEGRRTANRVLLILQFEEEQQLSSGDQFVFTQDDLQVIASVAGLRDRDA